MWWLWAQEAGIETGKCALPLVGIRSDRPKEVNSSVACRSGPGFAT